MPSSVVDDNASNVVNGGTVNNVAVPVNNVAVPVNNVAVPVNNVAVPVNNVAVPMNNVAVPMNNGAVPVNNGAVPVNNVGVPVNNVPMNNVAVPVNNVPVNNVAVGNVASPSKVLPNIAEPTQVIPPSAFDSSSSEPYISVGDLDEQALSSSDMELKWSSGESVGKDVSANEQKSGPGEETKDSKYSEDSGSSKLSIETESGSSPSKGIEERVKGEALASVEGVSATEKKSSTVEIPRPSLPNSSKIYIPVATSLKDRRSTGSTSQSSSEIKSSNATTGISVGESIGDPASFSSDFSSQTDKSAPSGKNSFSRNNPGTIGGDKKNGHLMGPLRY